LSRERLIAFAIVVAGILLSFFGSFVTTDPPVAGMVRWAPFHIVVQMYYGVLPSPDCERCGVPLVRSVFALPLEVTAEYLLMVFALIALYLRRPPRLILSIAIVGTFLGIGATWSVGTRLSFQETFYGLPGHGGHVHYGHLLIVYVVVMVALLLISAELLDQESSQAKPPS